MAEVLTEEKLIARGAVLVQRAPDRELWEFVQKRKNGWRSFYFHAPDRTSKSTWWIGWNGTRLARNYDAGRLAEHAPELYAWVVATLRQHYPDEILAA